MNKRPNILFLLADQMRFDCLGVNNPHIKTPNLDRLAKMGTQFTRAYPPTPVCLPCRAAIVSGQYCSSNRAPHNASGLEEDHEVLLGQTFADAGYYTHMIGKSHLASCHDPMSKESIPFIHNREYYRRWRGPWYGFEFADIAIGHTVENHAHGMHYGAWLENQGVDVEKYFGNNEYDDYGSWELPEEYHNSRWVALKTKEGIDAARDDNKPFMIWSNFQDPHNPCLVPEPWASMYDPESLPTYGFKTGEPECFKDKPPHYQDILNYTGPYSAKGSDSNMSDGMGNVCHLGYDQKQTQENAAAYYGMISLMDKYVGEILDHLEATGEIENTIIVFSADHGEILGDHGMWYKSLVCYDESIHIPMLVAWPGQVPADAKSDAFQNLIDLFPTFCSFAGIKAPWQLEGVDQREAWLDAETIVRSDTIVEEKPNNLGFNQRVLIDDEYKCAFYADRDYGELYDVKEDPHHVNNLWDKPDYAEVKMRMIHRILSHEMNKGPARPTESMKQAWHHSGSDLSHG